MSKTPQAPPPTHDYPLPTEQQAPPTFAANTYDGTSPYWAADMAREMALALLANPRLEQIINTTRNEPVTLAQALHDYCHRAATAWVAAQREAAQ